MLIAPNHIQRDTGELTVLETAQTQGAISGKYYFEAGAVLYSKIRPNLVKATIAPCNGLCSADMYPLVAKPSLRSEYLLDILLSTRFTQYAVSGSARTGIPKLNRDHLAKYTCKIPSLSEQDQYLQITSTVRATRAELSDRIATLKLIKQSIMQEISG